MTKRERTIAIVVGAVVGLYVLDQVLLTPLLTRLSDADKKTAAHNHEISDNNDILRKRLAAGKIWRPLAGDRVKADKSSAQSQMLTRVLECAQRANLAVPSYQSEADKAEQGYERLALTITASGGMRQISRFIYELQTADVPLRVDTMQLKSRTDGKDDLNLQLKLTTIFQPPTVAKVAISGWRTEAYQ